MKWLAIIACLWAPVALGQAAFDATSGHSACFFTGDTSTTTTLSVAVTIVAGETAFAQLGWIGGGAHVVSIAGGGTWSQIGTDTAQTGVITALWSTTAGGTSSASTVTATMSVAESAAGFICVAQYKYVSSITSGSFNDNNASTGTTASCSATAGSLGLVIGGCDNSASTTATANTGNLRLAGTPSGAGAAGSFMDNTGSAGIAATYASGSWSCNCVPVVGSAAPVTTPTGAPQSLMGVGY